MFLISCICGIRFPFRIRAEDNSGTDLALYLLNMHSSADFVSSFRKGFPDIFFDKIQH